MTLAAGAGDAELLKLLLERGAPRAARPLSAAVDGRCSACVDLLLEHAEAADLTGALTEAVGTGDLSLVKKLLDRNARASGDVLLFAALSPVAIPIDMTKALIGRGANPHPKTLGGVTVVELAMRQGNTSLVSALAAVGVRDDQPAPTPARLKPASSVRAAIERSIPALQRADVAFLDRAGCVSCHNNSLTAMTVAAARMAGVTVDEGIAKTQLRRIGSFLHENRERALEDLGLPGGIDTVSYILLGMAAERYPSDTNTDAWARYVKNRQSADGSWRVLTTLRPPLESSDFQVTAASIRSLQTYGARTQRPAKDKAVTRATRWLEGAQAQNTEDRAFKLLGLVWGRGSGDAIRRTAQDLLARQSADGGWAQVDSLASDAYATGQALVALRESRVIRNSDAAFKRGIQHLLNSQLEDGSWYVKTRAVAIQPYFDSDFPHGSDQFISAAATNWATMALTAAAR